MQSAVVSVPGGDAGLQRKLDLLRGLVDAAVRDPRFRARALRLVAHVPERDHVGEFRAVSRYVRQVRYTHDPPGIEVFTDPRRLAAAIDAGSAQAAGDCDDFAVLSAALHESIGRPTRFVVGGDGGGAWRHIWVEALVPGIGWMADDATVRRRAPGWSPAGAFAVVASVPALGHHGAMRQHREQPRPVRYAYGGAAALQGLGEVDGFKLKKLVQKVTRPIEKAVSKVTPAPIKKAASIVTRPLQQAWSVTGKAYGAAAKVVRQANQLVAPFRPIAANVLLPGSGVVVDQLQRRFMPQPSAPMDLPTIVPGAAPPPFVLDQGPGGGGSGGASSFAPSEPSESSAPSMTTILAIGGAALVAVLLIRRR